MTKVHLIAVMLLLGGALAGASDRPATTAPATRPNDPGKAESQREQIVHTFMGTILLNEDGLVVSVKREKNGHVKTVMIADATNRYSVYVTPKGPFGKPHVQYYGSPKPRSDQEMVWWSDYNGDGRFDAKIVASEHSAYILLNGKWVKAVRTGEGKTAPFKTDSGTYIFDADSGTWQSQ